MSNQYNIPPIPAKLAEELTKAIKHIAKAEAGQFHSTGGGWDAGGQQGVEIMSKCMQRLIAKHTKR